MEAEFTARDLAEAAERELRQRERVYPRLVAEGRMAAGFAERQIAMMREIAFRLGVEAAVEDAAGRLL